MSIVKAPQARTADADAHFRLRARTKRLSCRRDALRYRPCSESVKYSGLKPGRHTFRVRARLRGRTTFLSRRWTVLKRTDPRLGSEEAPEIGTAAPTTDPRTGAAAAGARPILVEEFDGTTLDTSTWFPYNGPGHAGFGLRRPSALALDGQGNLVITADMQNGQIVSGGMAQRVNFTYGRVEFRVRTEPDPTGTMSAIVMTWPKDQWSPEFTENDIYETGARVDNRTQFNTFIHFGTVHNWQKWTTHYVDPSQWHTIAMDWQPDLLEIYIDGAVAFSISDPAVIPDILHHVSIQLDARATRTLAKPQRMWVDFIRVYR